MPSPTLHGCAGKPVRRKRKEDNCKRQGYPERETPAYRIDIKDIIWKKEKVRRS
jgi:hypothetical protein